MEKKLANKVRKHLLSLPTLIVILLIMFPLLAKDVYVLHLMVMIFIWAIVATNWNMMVGYAGVFHYAQIAFLAIGGYVSAILTLNTGVSPWIGLVIAGACAALFSILLGWPITRVKGIYLILLTFAFHYLLLSSIFHLRFVTGGSQGLVRVPTFQLGPLVFERAKKFHYYYLAFTILLLSTFVHKKIVNSPIGMALVALRDSEQYAISQGVNPYKYRIFAFVICSFITGVAGALYTHFLGYISPEILGFSVLIDVLSMMVVGGLGTIEGPIIGSFLLTFASEYLRGVGPYRNIIIGLLAVLVLIFMPTGLVKALRRARESIGSITKWEK